jgi:hypothetical protein
MQQVVGPLDESQGLSQLHGHGPWLVREVALSLVALTPYFLVPLQSDMRNLV